MNRKPAFTLIELLVVISIIALLIGILLPALGAARRTAQSSASGSNQRQIGIAMAAFQADNKGFFPLWQRGDLNITDEADVNYQIAQPVAWYWTTRLAIDGYLPSMDLYNDPAFDADNTFLDIPLDRDVIDGRIFNSIHYGYNYVWVGSNLGSNLGSRSAQFKTREGGPISRAARVEDIQDATSTVVTVTTKNFDLGNDPVPAPAINGNGVFTPGQDYGAHVTIDADVAVTNAGIPHFRHSNGVQSMWADGHVSLIRGQITQEEQDASAIGLRGEVFLEENGLGSTITTGGGGVRGGGGSSNADKSNIWDLKADKPDN